MNELLEEAKELEDRLFKFHEKMPQDCANLLYNLSIDAWMMMLDIIEELEEDDEN